MTTSTDGSQNQQKLSGPLLVLGFALGAANALRRARTAGRNAPVTEFPAATAPSHATRPPVAAAAVPFTAPAAVLTEDAQAEELVESVELEGPDDGLYYLSGYRVALYDSLGAKMLGLHSNTQRYYEVTEMPLGTVFALHDHNGQATRATAWRRGLQSFTVAVALTPPSGLPSLMPGSGA
jgi:hypothetical protein